MRYLDGLNDSKLMELADLLGLQSRDQKVSRSFLMEIIISHYERRMSQVESINEQSIYPTEDLLWDRNLIPTDEYNGEHCLALPKLNLQFLTFHDYLLRNYDLYRLESCYEIRLDIEDAIRRVAPRKETGTGQLRFTGWSRMALPIQVGYLWMIGF